MVRAPCCEKMGLKKGPWTPEEDQILVAYIQRYGHENWRALPKQAGLLRCGKSCRLRWTNYLRPDIKRGNFSIEEEETIIKLHESLGNRWSVIAASLPGRTDNEIKNVWNSHLKKRLNLNQSAQESKRKSKTDATMKIGSKPITLQLNSAAGHPRFQIPSVRPVSPSQSQSDISSSGTYSSAVTGENYSSAVDEECMDSSEVFPAIDDSFWSDALSMEDCTAPTDFTARSGLTSTPLGEPFYTLNSSTEDEKDFWLTVLMEVGELPELPQI